MAKETASIRNLERKSPLAQLQDSRQQPLSNFTDLIAADSIENTDLTNQLMNEYMNKAIRHQTDLQASLSSIYNSQAQEAYIFGMPIDKKKLREDRELLLLKEEDKCCRDSLNNLKRFVLKLQIPGVVLDPEFLNDVDFLTANHYLNDQK